MRGLHVDSLRDVSIVITCYNKIIHLNHFESQLLNYYHLSPEIIIVDDYSVDGSREHILGLMTTFPNIEVVLNTENKGSAETRNIALEKASRDFVFFLDIDDQIDVAVLETMAKIAVDESADLCRGGYTILDSTQEDQTFNQKPTIIKGEISDNSYAIAEDMGYWRYLYSRSFLEKNGIKFLPTASQLSRGYFILDDAFFMILVASVKGKIVFMNNYPPVYKYFQGIHNQETWRKFQNQAQWFARASILCYEYVHKRGNFSLDIFSSLLANKTMSHMRYLSLLNWFNAVADLISFFKHCLLINNPFTLFRFIRISLLFALKNSIAFRIQRRDS
jgi:glycosyltransferase involved in cell wall biosynthesis